MNQEDKIEDLLRKRIKEEGLEQPSFDFADKTMKMIQSEALVKKTASISYKAPISKGVWIVLALIFSSFLMYSLFTTADDVQRLPLEIPRIDWAAYFNISPLFTYSFSLCMILFLISSILWSRKLKF